MSDGYVLDRAGTQVKRRKPPKKPRGRPTIIPWYCLAIFAAHFAIGYGVAASSHQTGNAVAFGIVLVVYARDLWLWWAWRRWARYTGTTVPNGTGHRGVDIFTTSLMIALAGFFVVKDLLGWFLNGTLPGQ